MSTREQGQFRRLEEALRVAIVRGAVVKGVDVVSGKVGGRPCIAGTRIDVHRVWMLFFEGVEPDAIAAFWSGITERQVRDALRALRHALVAAKMVEPRRSRVRRAA